jgi:hypothetical protein
MATESTQAQAETTGRTTDAEGWDFTTKLAVICAVWTTAALLAGIGLVAVSDVLAGIVA